ncbi:1-acyl-sn-glycerol-3-phosphate acyltransferase [Candidatus Woesearchaeota archaeon]|nr:1-acyl-sn-glycerol-3-phosphate acyltransferase [Candidatus Woesearchaeota archaeon]MBW3017800.1 1-acyl-sn-glycerol-3-phosphate acyltransferase [Candidatus Woesearchaeota archaeon]
MGRRTDFENVDLEKITLDNLGDFDFSEISFDFNEDFYRTDMKNFASWFLSKAFGKWNCITGKENLDLVPENLPVAFIANHREHSDYLIHALMLFLHPWSPPKRNYVKIAAGENLYLKLPHPFFPILNIDKWIRWAGAFQVYRKANQSDEEKKRLENRLALFVSKLVSENESILLYPDSGRAYSGKSKFNPAALSLLMTGQHITGKDLCVVPMATSYEKTPSDRYFKYFEKLKEIKKTRKPTLKEQFDYYFFDWPGLFIHVLTRDLGNAYTNIGKPIVIKADDIPSTLSQIGRHSVRLNKRIQAECEKLVEVTATALFCRAVKKMQESHSGCDGKLYLPDLVSVITEERECLRNAGARISHVVDSEKVAERAIGFLCSLFRRMIYNSHNTVTVARQDVVDYYANNIAHFR